jgi:hypothetical protein
LTVLREHQTTKLKIWASSLHRDWLQIGKPNSRMAAERFRVTAFSVDAKIDAGAKVPDINSAYHPTAEGAQIYIRQLTNELLSLLTQQGATD